jgi:hypothetical protein
MQTSKSYTTGSVLAALGYPDPLVAARQQARMILLGRLARYQAAIQQLESQWERSCALVTRLRGAKILQPMMTTCSGSGTPTLSRLSRPNWLLSLSLEPCFRSLVFMHRNHPPSPTWKTCCASSQAGWTNILA